MIAATGLVILLAATPAPVPELQGWDIQTVDLAEDYPVKAAGWCAVRRRDEQGPACDMGLAAAIHSWGRLSAVGFLGTETLGLGLAWTLYHGRDWPTIAIGAGLAAEWNSDAIYTDEVYPVIGATLSFRRKQ